MSRSSPSSGTRGSPLAEVPISGQGFGLNWQNRKNRSPAGQEGWQRLLCTKPGASLAVGPRWPPPYREPRFVPAAGSIVAAKGGDVHGRAPIRANRARQVEHPPPVARAALAHFVSNIFDQVSTSMG